MAIGVEKVKDSGYQGLVGGGEAADRRHRPHAHRGGDVRDVRARATARSTASSDEQMREVLARIAWKNHYNGARNPRAQFRKRGVDGDDLQRAADGRRARRVRLLGRRRRLARPRSSCGPRTRTSYTDKPLYIKALSFVAGNCSGNADPDYDYTTFPEIAASRRRTRTRRPASPTRASQIAMAEVHDCFTPTELLIYEDLGFAERGTAWKEVLDGTFDLDGDLPVNPDGGLKSFGHPVGASGLRMMFECWLQLRGEAPEERRITTADRGLGAHAQPRRLPRRDGQLRRHRRHRARLIIGGPAAADATAVPGVCHAGHLRCSVDSPASPTAAAGGSCSPGSWASSASPCSRATSATTSRQGFSVKGTESTRAQDLLQATFPERAGDSGSS